MRQIACPIGFLHSSNLGVVWFGFTFKLFCEGYPRRDIKLWLEDLATVSTLDGN